MSRAFAFLAASFVLFSVGQVRADNDEYPGYLGVLVVEDDDGMKITGFIHDTPAAALAEDDKIDKGDVIVELNGKKTTSIKKLLKARNTIGDDEEAKMVLERPSGKRYHVWISRSTESGTPGTPASADRLQYGGEGEGGEATTRKRTGGKEGDGGTVRKKNR